MYLSEQFKVIGLGTSTDFNAGFTADSINTTNLHHVMFVLTYGAVGGAGAAALTVKSGASAGTQTTAETFSSRYGGAAQGATSADVYSAWASGTSVAVATATITTRTQIIEIDCKTLTEGQPWITLALDGTADSGIVHAVAICVPRFPGERDSDVDLRRCSMLKAEISQVEQIANDIMTRSVNAAVSILSAKIAELEVKINRLAELDGQAKKKTKD